MPSHTPYLPHATSPAQPSSAQLGPFDPSPLETKVFSKRIRTQNVIDPNPRRRGGRRQQKGATCNVPPATCRTSCKLRCDLRQFVNLLLPLQLPLFVSTSSLPCHLFLSSLPLLQLSASSSCLSLSLLPPLSATSRFLRSQLGFVAKNKQQHSQIFG